MDVKAWKLVQIIVKTQLIIIAAVTLQKNRVFTRMIRPNMEMRSFGLMLKQSWGVIPQKHVLVFVLIPPIINPVIVLPKEMKYLEGIQLSLIILKIWQLLRKYYVVIVR